LKSPKYDLGKSQKAIFEVVEWHFELIFRILTFSKCDLDEVDKRILKISQFTLI